jgi:hypothetical protein
MGPIESAVRNEIDEGSALAEIAFALAFQLDNGEGGASSARELRFILSHLKTEQSRKAVADDPVSILRGRKRQADSA